VERFELLKAGLRARAQGRGVLVKGEPAVAREAVEARAQKIAAIAHRKRLVSRDLYRQDRRERRGETKLVVRLCPHLLGGCVVLPPLRGHPPAPERLDHGVFIGVDGLDVGLLAVHDDDHLRDREHHGRDDDEGTKALGRADLDESVRAVMREDRAHVVEHGERRGDDGDEGLKFFCGGHGSLLIA